jgi:hypothetical protein
MIQELKPLTTALDAQGVLQPGEEGFWQVWGASIRDVCVGDLIMVKWSNPDRTTAEITEHEVAEVRRDIPLGVTDTEGNRFRIGALQQFRLFRKGTHNTLSNFCR